MTVSPGFVPLAQLPSREESLPVRVMMLNSQCSRLAAHYRRQFALALLPVPFAEAKNNLQRDVTDK